MKTITRSGRRGPISIANGSCSTLITRGAGKGHSLFIGTYGEMEKINYNGDYKLFNKEWQFIGWAEGNAINIFDYNGNTAEHMVSLCGRYVIYRHKNGKNLLIEQTGSDDWRKQSEVGADVKLNERIVTLESEITTLKAQIRVTEKQLEHCKQYAIELEKRLEEYE